MNEKMLQLKKEFERISKKGYIKGIYNCTSSIGRTFEDELNLPRNEYCIPDYYGIEIKTRRAYSKSAITLFNAVPDGEELYEVERIKNTYGYPSKKDRNYKVLYFDAYGDKLTFGGIKYQYKLDIDRKDKRIYLCVYNKYDELIEKKVFWSFKYLKQKLQTKLKYLAIINAWTNVIDNWNYFKYYKIEFYIIKNFEKFINLLEDGTIKIVFKVGIYLDKEHYGKTYNHGCGFAIGSNDITKLYYRYIPESKKIINKIG